MQHFAPDKMTPKWNDGIIITLTWHLSLSSKCRKKCHLLLPDYYARYIRSSSCARKYVSYVTRLSNTAFQLEKYTQ